MGVFMPTIDKGGNIPTGRPPQLDVGQLEEKEKCPECVDGYVLISSAPGLDLVKGICKRCKGKGNI